MKAELMPNKFTCVGLLLVLSVAGLSCEIHTKLSIKGGNPPTFVMTGNGTLTSIRIRGHERQREAEGEEASLYWVIKPEKGGAQIVGDIGSITYGKVPEGYRQQYPENGEAPLLNEGEHYYVRVVTSNANGADGYFMILKGQAIFAKYESELPDEVKRNN